MSRKLLRTCLVLLFACGVICGSVIGIRAIFISGSSHKEGVVAGPSYTRFSGDYLLASATPPQYPILAKTYATAGINVNVYNFPYGIPEEYSRNDIQYDIVFLITDPTTPVSEKTYAVTKRQSDPLKTGTVSTDVVATQSFVGENGAFKSITFNEETRFGIIFENETLSGGKATGWLYTIDVPELTVVEIIAIPKDKDLPTLSTKLQRVIVTEAGSSATIEWAGKFLCEENLTPADYAAFPYQIYGAGTGTYTLKWDPAKLELDQNSLKGVAVTYDTGSATFHVDSGEREMYIVRFFKKAAFADWDAVNACIDVEGCYLPD